MQIKLLVKTYNLPLIPLQVQQLFCLVLILLVEIQIVK